MSDTTAERFTDFDAACDAAPAIAASRGWKDWTVEAVWSDDETARTFEVRRPRRRSAAQKRREVREIVEDEGAWAAPARDLD